MVANAAHPSPGGSAVTLLGALLPGSVAVEELREYPAELGLLPQEEAVVAKAVERRRREFAAVRFCARRALTRLGHAPVPILPGERGAPSWPPGIVGSMTHCLGYAAAALACSTQVGALGIDAEPHSPLPDGVLAAVALPAEAEQVGYLGAERPEIHWDRLLFSAKESVYKTWYPLTRTWLGFEQALIHLDPVRGTFSARLLVPGSDASRPESFTGRWGTAGGIVATAVAVLR
jgi:4'-phosphopantetheinyl transferase EntD